MAAPALTQAQLKELLHYDPGTGAFTRLKTSHPRAARYVGQKCGTIHSSGYVYITLLGKPRRAHRLAWLYMMGDEAPADIDHRNGNRADNRWANLRAATRSQNNANRAPTPGASGTQGVIYDSRYSEPWKAQISINNKTIVIGRLPSREAAAAAYRAAAAARSGQFARFE